MLLLADLAGGWHRCQCWGRWPHCGCVWVGWGPAGVIVTAVPQAHIPRVSLMGLSPAGIPIIRNCCSTSTQYLPDASSPHPGCSCWGS